MCHTHKHAYTYTCISTHTAQRINIKQTHILPLAMARSRTLPVPSYATFPFSMTAPFLHPPKGNHQSDFRVIASLLCLIILPSKCISKHYNLVLPVFELYTNAITQCVFFCVCSSHSYKHLISSVLPAFDYCGGYTVIVHYVLSLYFPND